MSDLISFIFGSRQRLNISPGTVETPRSSCSSDINTFPYSEKSSLSIQQFQRGLVLVVRDADVPQGETGGERNSGKALKLGTVA